MNLLQRRAACVSVLAAALAAGACSDIEVPDYNRAGTGDLVNAPNKTLVDAASLGLLQNARRDAAGRTRLAGALGREGYYLDPNEQRYVSELVTGNIDPSSFAGNHDYSNPYGTLAQGQLILTAIDKVGPNEYTDAQRQAIRGFVNTLMAQDLFIVAMLHQYGPTAVNPDPLAPPADMKTQAQMFTRVAELLDAAVPQLKAGGGTFPWGTTSMPSGFTQFASSGFTNPSGGFLKFNRALRARLDIMMGNYAAAVVHLDSSFLSTSAGGTRAELNTGVYYTYSAASGDLVNGLAAGTPEIADTLLWKQAVIHFDTTFSVTKPDSIVRIDTLRDNRLRLKVDTVGSSVSRYSITSTSRFTLYRTSPFYGGGGSASPIPVIRNEELILNRAEARWFTNNKAGALSDLNFVRKNSGGLKAYDASLANTWTDAQFKTALLYERRYSLMYEGGMRWFDLRRFGLLDTVGKDYPRAGDKIPQFFPIPFTECLARGGPGSAPGC